MGTIQVLLGVHRGDVCLVLLPGFVHFVALKKKNIKKMASLLDICIPIHYANHDKNICPK